LRKDDFVLKSGLVGEFWPHFDSRTNAPNQPGISYFGPNQVEVSFGDGYRCVGGTVRRLPVSFASGGSLSRAVNYNAHYASGFITVGSPWNFQAWFRDPDANGANYNLSDGLHITFCP